MKYLTILPAALAVSLFSTGSLPAQDSNRPTSNANVEPKTVSVTGCLERPKSPGVAKQYVIKSGEMTYEVYPGAENLKAHIGHKVTISGISMKGEGPHDDDRIRATKVTMVSTTCP